MTDDEIEPTEIVTEKVEFPSSEKRPEEVAQIDLPKVSDIPTQEIDDITVQKAVTSQIEPPGELDLPPPSGTSATATSAFESDIDKPDAEIKPSEKVPSPVPEVPEEMGQVSSSFQEMSGKSESEDSSSISAQQEPQPGIVHSTPAKMKPFEPPGMEEKAETYDYVSTDDEIAPISPSKSGSEFLDSVEKKEFSSRTVDSTGEKTFSNAEEKEAGQRLQDLIQTASGRIAEDSRRSSGTRSPVRRSAVIAEVAKPIISSRLESRMKDEIQTEEDANSMVDFVAEKIKPEVANRYTGSSSSSITSDYMPTHQELEDIVDNELKNLTDSDIREGGVKHKAIRLVEGQIISGEDAFKSASTGGRAEILTNEALPFITKKATSILDQPDAKPEDLIRSSEYIAEKADAKFTQVGQFETKPDQTSLRKSVEELTETITKNELQEAIRRQKDEDRQARNKTAMIIEAAKPVIRTELGNRFPDESDYDSMSEFIGEAIKPTIETQYGKSNEVPTQSQLEDIIGSTLKNYSDAEIKQGAKHADKISPFKRRSSSGTLEKFKQGSIDDKETILDRETVPIVSNIARNILTGQDISGSGSTITSPTVEPADLVVASETILGKVKEEYQKWTDRDDKPENDELTKSIIEIAENISKSDLEDAIFSQANAGKRADILVNDSQDIVSDMVERKLAGTEADRGELSTAENIVNERLRDTYKEEFGTADRKPSKDSLRDYVESSVNSFSSSELLAADQGRRDDSDDVNSMLDRSAIVTESIKPIIEEKLKERFISDQTEDIDAKLDYISDSIKPTIASDYAERSKVVKLSDLENIIDNKLDSLTDSDINQGAAETRDRRNKSDIQSNDRFSNETSNKKAEILVADAAPTIVKAVGSILGDSDPERIVPGSQYVADIARSQFEQDFGNLSSKPDADTLNKSVENIARGITKEELESVIGVRDDLGKDFRGENMHSAYSINN